MLATSDFSDRAGVGGRGKIAQGNRGGEEVLEETLGFPLNRSPV